MAVLALDHIQLAMPPGREADTRAFYGGPPGLDEETKPPGLAERGGCWFKRGALKVHLGVENDFRSARKAHPAFIVDDVRMLAARAWLSGGGGLASCGYNRVYVDDPLGNRLELMEPKP